MANISYVYLINPTFQFMNVSGKPLTDGYVNLYISGTRSKYYAFSDFEGTLHPFNIPLNALGSAVILVSPAHSYDIYVYNALGTLQMSRYNITPATGEGTVITDVTTLNSKDGTVDITANSSTDYDLSIATKIAELKAYTDQAKNDAIESANTSIADLDARKKDKQTELNFNGSATKTVKKITQNANGELNVEFEDIDLPGYSISSSDGSINVSTSEGVTDLTLPSDVVRDSAYTHIDAATANPLMNSNAAVGISTKYAREDHVHPSDTSKEDIVNKTTVVLGTSDSKYPTDKAVADFVNSSIATNTANYISNNGEPFTSVEQLEAYSGPVTNNDYAFVTGTDSEGNTYYDRYKATVSGETVTWALEYRLNNSSFTAAQWSAINSGITSVLVDKIHDHSNKTVLDGITSTDVANWNSKQNSLTAGDNITIDGSTISSDQVFVATYGITTFKEIKDAYDAGKICVLFRYNRIFYLELINEENIRFMDHTPEPSLYSMGVNSANKWSSYGVGLQSKLTFDAEPTTGSNNPVTSDGIKTAISNSIDQTYSYTSKKAQSGVAVNEAFKTRETSSSDASYTYLGMNITQQGTEVLYWKLVSFKAVKSYWSLQFEVDVSNGKKTNGSYDTEIYETKRLTICGTNPGSVVAAREMRYVGQGLDPNRGYGNNIYFEIGSDNLVTVYIKAINTSNKRQICRLKDVRNIVGISDITWYEVSNDAGTQPTKPVKFTEIFPAIASTLSNIGSDSVPVYVNKGKPVSCNSSNLKAGKDDDGNVIKNTYQKKLTFDTTPTAGSTNPVTSDGIKKELDKKLNVDGSNATTEGVTAMMKKVESGSADLTNDSYYFGDSNNDHTQIVRRPILNLWNYFAPKVDSKIVDRLGSVGSADKPIYLENGVPKVCTDGVPYSSVNYGGSDGYGVFVGGAHNLANTTRCYCTFLVTVSSFPDNIAHTYIGTFSFRGGILNSELKCLTGTPAYPHRIAIVYTKDGGTTSNPTYTVGVHVIPDDKTYKYSGYNLTRIASTSDFIWDVKAINSATYDELNSVAKPALRPIILTWDAIGSNVSTTGGTWTPTFDKATIIDCRGIVDMSIQVDLSIIGQTTYIDDFTSYDITLVNSSKTDILPVSLHQKGRMPRATRSSTGGGTIDTSCTHRFIFPITSSTNLLAGYRPKITLPSNYTLDSGAQVNIKALCRGIVLPYGADEYF